MSICIYHDRTCWRVGCGERERENKAEWGDMDHIDGETEFSKEENQEGSHLKCCCLPQSFPAGATNLQLGSSSPEEMPTLWYQWSVAEEKMIKKVGWFNLTLYITTHTHHTADSLKKVGNEIFERAISWAVVWSRWSCRSNWRHSLPSTLCLTSSLSANTPQCGASIYLTSPPPHNK